MCNYTVFIEEQFSTDPFVCNGNCENMEKAEAHMRKIAKDYGYNENIEETWSTNSIVIEDSKIVLSVIPLVVNSI